MKSEEIKRLVAKSENVALEFKRAKGSEMKAEKQRLKTAGYISLPVGKISHGDGQ